MKYGVVLDPNGGILDGSNIISTETGYFEFPTNPSRYGYDFNGWYKDKDCVIPFVMTSSDPSKLDVPIASDVTLYAGWTKITFDVTFLDQDGTKIAQQFVLYNTQASFVDSPGYEGHTFKGWYKDSTFTKSYSFTDPITEAITLYPKFDINNIKVSFKFQEVHKNYDNDVYVKYGETANIPEELSIYGYAFDGYYTGTDYLTKFNFATVITSPIIIYPKYNQIMVSVKFIDNDNGTVYATIPTAYGSTVQVPTTPTKTGFTFNTWMYNSNKINFNDIIEADRTYTASWTSIDCTTTFSIDGKTDQIPQQHLSYGDTVSSPSDPEKEGYKFLYWCTNPSGTEKYNMSLPLTGAITLYAIFTINTFTVTFMCDSEQFAERIVSYNNHCPNPVTESYQPTKENSQFVGWLKEDKTPFSFDTLITTNVTLTASFSTCKVSIDFNYGYDNLTSTSKEFDKGSAYDEPIEPKREGYEFGGWCSDNARTILYNFSTEVTTHIVLYAKWIVNAYTVTINFNDDDNTVKNLTVNYGETVAEPDHPSLIGFVFRNWYTGDNVENVFDFSTPIKGDTEINAHFSEYLDGSTDNFIQMLLSDKYYLGKDIKNALTALRFTKCSKIENYGDFTIPELAVIFEASIFTSLQLDDNKYYNVYYDNSKIEWVEKPTKYTVSLSYKQLYNTWLSVAGQTPDSKSSCLSVAGILETLIWDIKDGKVEPDE